MMTRAAGVVLLCVIVLSCSGGGGSAEPGTPVRTVLAVEGMHCDSCSSSITASLEAIDGVESAAADHEAGTAEAICQSGSVEPEELKTAIEDLGYTVTSWRTETTTEPAPGT
jgi:copper chaperone CopZ